MEQPGWVPTRCIAISFFGEVRIVATRRAFAVPGLVLALLLSAGSARAESWLQLDVSVSTTSTVFDGLQVRIVFDPNAAPVLDNGVNGRQWATEQVLLNGTPVIPPPRIQSTYAPSPGFSLVGLLGSLDVGLGADRLLNLGMLLRLNNMVYGGPWPAANSWPAFSDGEVFLSISGPKAIWQINSPGDSKIIEYLYTRITVTNIPAPVADSIFANGYED